MPASAKATAVALDRRLTFGTDSYPFTVCAGPGVGDVLDGRFALRETGAFILAAAEGIPGRLLERACYCPGDSAPVIPAALPDGEENKTAGRARETAASAGAAGAAREWVAGGRGRGTGLSTTACFAVHPAAWGAP